MASQTTKSRLPPVDLHELGDSRKYPYHTTGGILEFRGRGGVSWTGIPKTRGVTQFGIPKAWGGVSALNSVNFQRKDGESSA